MSLVSGGELVRERRVVWNRFAARFFWLVLFGGLVSGFSDPGCRAGFDPAKLEQIDSEIEQAIRERRLPGGVFWLESKGVRHHKAFGFRAVVPQKESMTEDTIFDVASLTKVLATTPAILILYERGRLELDAPVSDYLPEFQTNRENPITVRHLLTHTSGLARTPRRPADWADLKRAIRLLGSEAPAHRPGTRFQYSDLNFIVLGEVVQRVSGMSLDRFAAREIFEPLGMTDTAYLPPDSRLPRIAPTEKTGHGVLRGLVHDPKARRMGGVAGHAGVFSTAADIARFARMLLNGGELDGVRVLRPETVRLMTSVQSPPFLKVKRGLGWDMESGFSRPRGSLFPAGSYGHTGFTGVCLWIDPSSGTFWMLLSNRVHPNGSGNIYALQEKLGTLAAEAIRQPGLESGSRLGAAAGSK